MIRSIHPRSLFAWTLVLILVACGGEPTTADSTDSAERQNVSTVSSRIDDSRSHFVIEGAEQATANPQVSVHVDPGQGEGLFNDGIARYEIRMLPKPLAKDALTVWILNLREDMVPGRIELTDSHTTPSVIVGVGRGLLKGYHEVLSGHLELAELGDQITLDFEAKLESQAALDKARRGQQVTVRGRVVAAKVPQPSGAQ